MGEISADYEIVIKPSYGILDLNWKELWEYRELLFFLALRQIKIKYKQSVIGIGWAILQPFFTMVVFTLIFGGLAKMPSEGVPYALFSYSGLLLWTYFSNSLTQSSTSLVGSSALLQKVYFPRLFIPTAPCLSNLLDYVIALSIIFLMMIYYWFAPPLAILLLPVVLFFTLLCAVGLGCILSSICVKYRDVQFALPFFIQLLMFLSPVIYPIDIIPEAFRSLLYLNPLTGLINAHRACLLGHAEIDFFGLELSMAMCVILFVAGVLYLRKTEKYFADLV